MRHRGRGGGAGMYDRHGGEQMRKERGIFHPMTVGVKKSKAS